MICSTIIPTIDRPELSRAVESILEQGLNKEDYEIIVVNDSGMPLNKADWQRSPLVKVININKCRISMARNVGAAVAKGEFLHFLDDDDYILPGAYNAFLKVAQISKCGWIYGGYRVKSVERNFMHDCKLSLKGDIFALIVAGEAIPLGASWIKRDLFFKANCFDHAFSGVVEDRDLERRLVFLTDIDGTQKIVACFRIDHPKTTSTKWSKTREFDRLSREKILDYQGILKRMRISVKSNTLWRGRICRAYLGSVAKNFEMGNYWKALGRLISCLQLGGFYIFLPRFWKGMRTRIHSIKK